MSSVKVVHGRQLRTKPARRHGYVHKMWKILLDFFGYLSVLFDHTSFSNENHHFNLDVDQSAADPALSILCGHGVVFHTRRVANDFDPAATILG